MSSYHWLDSEIFEPMQHKHTQTHTHTHTSFSSCPPFTHDSIPGVVGYPSRCPDAFPMDRSTQRPCGLQSQASHWQAQHGCQVAGNTKTRAQQKTAAGRHQNWLRHKCNWEFGLWTSLYDMRKPKTKNMKDTFNKLPLIWKVWVPSNPRPMLRVGMQTFLSCTQCFLLRPVGRTFFSPPFSVSVLPSVRGLDAAEEGSETTGPKVPEETAEGGRGGQVHDHRFPMPGIFAAEEHDELGNMAVLNNPLN